MSRICPLFCLVFSLLYAEPFVLFTTPKTGTHLLIPILESLTGKSVFWARQFQKHSESICVERFEPNNPDLIYFSIEKAPWTKEVLDKIWKINEEKGTFFHLHAPYTPVLESYLLEKRCINFFVKRDPRDQIVSLLNHYRCIDLNDSRLQFIKSDEERLFLMIQRDLKAYVLHFMGWHTSSASCVLDFGKLMGSHGGVATDLDALGEMRKIASALKIDRSDADLIAIYRSCFGHGWNFFKGKVNVWKDYFNEAHKCAAKEAIGDLLIELGYEKDLNW